MLDKDTIHIIQERYIYLVQNLRSKIEQDHSINVAFIIQYKAALLNIHSVLKAMLSDSLFSPNIIITIDNHRHSFDTTAITSLYNEAKAIYGDIVLMGYDTANNEDISLLEEFDIAWFTNPYIGMQSPEYSIANAIDKDCLTIYGDYSYNTICYTSSLICTYDFFNLLWLYCTDSRTTSLEYHFHKQSEGLKANDIVSHYHKMDALAELTSPPDKKNTCILITLHHTVGTHTPGFSLGTFILFAEYFLSLPQRYKDITFIFRPHPILFYALQTTTTWSTSMIDDYFTELFSYPNVQHSDKSNYFEDFVASDAIINDCASFTLEYLFTEKPACFLSREEGTIEDVFNIIGKQCLKHYYHAQTAQEIDSFIQNVVLSKEYDPLKPQRIQYAQQLKRYYPHASSRILNIIKQKVMGGVNAYERYGILGGLLF